MVEPVAFGFNEETAANNYFQQRTVAAGETVQACALKEFRGMVDKLRANGIEVIAVQDTPIPHTPDSIFPNNWVSFHASGQRCSEILPRSSVFRDISSYVCGKPQGGKTGGYFAADRVGGVQHPSEGRLYRF